MTMVRLRDFNPPPESSAAFYRWIGLPRPTGFNLYIGDYPYGVGLASNKRMRFKFPQRRGYSGTLISAAQTTQRQRFNAALQIYADQPYSTAGDAHYGPKGRNVWWDLAGAADLYAINYFVRLQMPHTIAGTDPPWGTEWTFTYVNPECTEPLAWPCGPIENSGTFQAGTYRARLYSSATPFYGHKTNGKYIIALTVEQIRAGAPIDTARLGRLRTDGMPYYADEADMAATAFGAYYKYLNDSDLVTYDFTLALGDHFRYYYHNNLNYVIEGEVLLNIEKIA